MIEQKGFAGSRNGTNRYDKDVRLPQNIGTFSLVYVALAVFIQGIGMDRNKKLVPFQPFLRHVN